VNMSNSRTQPGEGG